MRSVISSTAILGCAVLAIDRFPGLLKCRKSHSKEWLCYSDLIPECSLLQSLQDYLRNVDGGNSAVEFLVITGARAWLRQ